MEEGDVCMYQYPDFLYHMYLKESKRECCIGCEINDTNRLCTKSHFVRPEYKTRLLFDEFTLWRRGLEYKLSLDLTKLQTRENVSFMNSFPRQR